MSDDWNEFILEKTPDPEEIRYKFGARPLVETITGFVKKLSPQKGFVGADIALNWQAIVGEEIASLATPTKLSRSDGVLYLKLKSVAMAPMAEYQKPVIMDRVNSCFGYQAVKTVRFKSV
ncbi:MAG: DUF721 domain-containing protein [Alphaproteobacteria bacterium]|nr:DUF721 domain-containing protein [Alphaproteobacteria bacterium]